MFFSKKCPIDSRTAEWVEDSLLWFIDQFGEDVFFRSHVLSLEKTAFPAEVFSPEVSPANLLNFICDRMGVSKNKLRLVIDKTEVFNILDLGIPGEFSSDKEGGVILLKQKMPHEIIIHQDKLKDPLALVTILAHEVAHAALFEKNKATVNDEDHEQLTDLLLVFFGFGLYSCHAVFRASASTNGGFFQWSHSRLGYLSQPIIGYALSVCAYLKNDSSAWSKTLPSDGKDSFAKGFKYLSHSPPKPIESFVRKVRSHAV